MISATGNATNTLTGPSNSSASTTSAAANSDAATTDPAAMQDRFLKLLVAQIHNQDPMNPMDNAQMTSQMAQINTVNGIQQLNQTLTGMAAQFSAMQVLQGSSMVGQDVLTAGTTLTPNASTGLASAAFDLAGAADNVTVDILSPSGQVLDSVNMGTQAAGRHSFDWNTSSYQGAGKLSYRVNATLGQKPVTSTTLVREKVVSVGAVNGALSIQLQSGRAVSYSDVAAIL
jgi:flagellar basal-body rod modification protein FlgD